MARVDTITITFGDHAENHVGMQKLGAGAPAGFTYEDLWQARQKFEELGCTCRTLDLISEARAELLGGEGGPEPAYLLVVRDGIDRLLAAGLADEGSTKEITLSDQWFAEQSGLDFDKKALIRQEVKNKLARWNLCFADAAQEPAYEVGKGRVVAFSEVRLTDAVRRALPLFFGEKARGLVAEGNYYYNAAKCGIGFHGDTERKLVVGLRLGKTIPLHFQWFHHWKPEYARVALELEQGDLYAMSEKAVGADWKRPSIPTLRHAAGAAKYLHI